MTLFGNSEDSMGDLAWSRSSDNSQSIRELTRRLEILEKYLNLEWSESNQKYYKVADNEVEL